MARKKIAAGVSDYMAEIGRKGGQVKGRKGTATLTVERRREIAMKGVAARAAKAKKKGGKKAGKV